MGFLRWHSYNDKKIKFVKSIVNDQHGDASDIDPIFGLKLKIKSIPISLDGHMVLPCFFLVWAYIVKVGNKMSLNLKI